MEMTLPAMANSQLATFNTLALHYQDEAYTLAYYLLGDENRAAEATQAAFSRLYELAELRLDQFRLEILRWVLAASSQTGDRQARGKVRDELIRRLLTLNNDERSVVVLVDVLGLGYQEAAQVLGCNEKQLSKRLAQARLGLRPR